MKKTGVLENLTKVYVIAIYNLTQQVLLIEPLQRQASVEKIFITIEGQNGNRLIYSLYHNGLLIYRYHLTQYISLVLHDFSKNWYIE